MEPYWTRRIFRTLYMFNFGHTRPCRLKMRHFKLAVRPRYPHNGVLVFSSLRVRFSKIVTTLYASVLIWTKKYRRIWFRNGFDSIVMDFSVSSLIRRHGFFYRSIPKKIFWHILMNLQNSSYQPEFRLVAVWFFSRCIIVGGETNEETERAERWEKEENIEYCEKAHLIFSLLCRSIADILVSKKSLAIFPSSKISLTNSSCVLSSGHGIYIWKNIYGSLFDVILYLQKLVIVQNRSVKIEQTIFKFLFIINFSMLKVTLRTRINPKNYRTIGRWYLIW